MKGALKTHAVPARGRPAATSHRVAQRARRGPLHDSPRVAAQRARIQGAFGPIVQRVPEEDEALLMTTTSQSPSRAPVQRLPMSQKGMRVCGFSPFRGDEWMWLNPGGQPNHVSAIRTDGQVHHIHAKTEYKGGRINRLDWDESQAGTFNGPTEKRKEAEAEWPEWYPHAKAAGEETLELLKQNKKN